MFSFYNFLYVKTTSKTQQLLREKAVEACEWGRDLVENDEETLRKKFEQGGMEVIVLTPEQLKPFQDKVQGVRKELMEKYGEEACKAFNIH